MLRRFVPSLFLAAISCDAASPPKLVVEPLPGSKADVRENVTFRGGLEFGTAVLGEIASDLAFHAYTFDVAAMSDVRLEVTHKGSSARLDSTLFVFGRRDDAGNFGDSAIAFDDDSGWSRLSRIDSLQLEQPGTYLAVVGTPNARGRGRYRLVLSCNSGRCELPVVDPDCHPRLLDRLQQCIADALTDPDHAFEPHEAADLCADPEVLADTWDAICFEELPTPDICQLDIERFSLQIIPVCRALVG